eukprot:8816920-Alexandrium_andersonii.AAC.1
MKKSGPKLRRLPDGPAGSQHRDQPATRARGGALAWRARMRQDVAPSDSRGARARLLPRRRCPHVARQHSGGSCMG